MYTRSIDLILICSIMYKIQNTKSKWLCHIDNIVWLINIFQCILGKSSLYFFSYLQIIKWSYPFRLAETFSTMTGEKHCLLRYLLLAYQGNLSKYSTFRKHWAELNITYDFFNVLLNLDNNDSYLNENTSYGYYPV